MDDCLYHGRECWARDHPSGNALPDSPPGPRWWADRGAIPGEPMYYLDVQDGDLDTAKAAIVEVDSQPPTWEAHDKDGVLLIRADSLHKAATFVEFLFTQAPLG